MSANPNVHQNVKVLNWLSISISTNRAKDTGTNTDQSRDTNIHIFIYANQNVQLVRVFEQIAIQQQESLLKVLQSQ